MKKKKCFSLFVDLQNKLAKIWRTQPLNKTEIVFKIVQLTEKFHSNIDRKFSQVACRVGCQLISLEVAIQAAIICSELTIGTLGVRYVNCEIFHNVCNMFKVNIKDIGVTLMGCSGVFIINFEHISHLVSIVNFEQVNAGWVIFC